MVSCKRLAGPEFLASVRQYWSDFAVAREADDQDQPGRHVTSGALQENAFYLFDAEAIGAIGRAIEDLALEEANGQLTAVFQCQRSFEPQRERYTHLATTVDALRVYLPQRLPWRIPHARLNVVTNGACRRYCVTQYAGKRYQAMLIGHQTNQASAPEDRLFEGFYTFNPRLISRLQQDLAQVLAGALPLLREFHRLRLVAQAAQQIKGEFAREEEALEAAMQRLLLDGQRYCARQFASELERGLSRLGQWKNRLPELLARVDS